MAKLIDVTGIGPVTAKVLANHQIKTLETLAAINVKELEKIPSFSSIRAKTVKNAAKAYLLTHTNQRTSSPTSHNKITNKPTTQHAVAGQPDAPRKLNHYRLKSVGLILAEANHT